MTAKRKTEKAEAPWDKATPRKSRHTKLTSRSRAKAKASARKAGRHYPNLVDNMNAAKEQRSRRKKTTSHARKRSGKNKS
jgi:hypothetical protein